MKRRTPAILAAVVVAGLTATAVGLRWWQASPPSSRAPGPTVTAAATAHPSAPPSPAASASTPAAPLDRLTIAAMRARSYPASVLTLVRSDGDQGGYVNTVVSYQSDGFTVYALLSIPNSARAASGWPVIILNHGFIEPAMYKTDDASYAQFISAFAHAGYAVIKPDYRGNGQSQGAPEGGHFSPVYTYDVMNLISTLKVDARIDPNRIGLFGHSMGGHEALRVAVISKDVKAVVLMAGVVGSFNDIFYNWPKSPVTTDPPAIVQQIRTGLIAKYGTPKDDPSFWDSVSAVNYVSSITAAVQINHDTGDSVVPVTFSQHLASSLTAAGLKFDYYAYGGDDHQFVANRALILQRAVAFYKAHL